MTITEDQVEDLCIDRFKEKLHLFQSKPMKKRPYKKLYALSPEQYVEYALCNLCNKP